MLDRIAKARYIQRLYWQDKNYLLACVEKKYLTHTLTNKPSVANIKIRLSEGTLQY